MKFMVRTPTAVCPRPGCGHTRFGGLKRGLSFDGKGHFHASDLVECIKCRTIFEVVDGVGVPLDRPKQAEPMPDFNGEMSKEDKEAVMRKAARALGLETDLRAEYSDERRP